MPPRSLQPQLPFLQLRTTRAGGRPRRASRVGPREKPPAGGGGSPPGSRTATEQAAASARASARPEKPWGDSHPNKLPARCWPLVRGTTRYPPATAQDGQQLVPLGEGSQQCVREEP